MTGTQKALTAAGIAAAILYAVTRSEKGQTVTVDAIEGVITGAGALLRGIRNNNPGNLRFIADAAHAWRGQLPDPDDRGFGRYDTAANGVRAIGKQLEVYEARGLRTPRAWITAYAPASENDLPAYINDVCRRVGVAADSPLSVASKKAELVDAIIWHENGINPYTERELRAWVAS